MSSSSEVSSARVALYVSLTREKRVRRVSKAISKQNGIKKELYSLDHVFSDTADLLLGSEIHNSVEVEGLVALDDPRTDSLELLPILGDDGSVVLDPDEMKHRLDSDL